MDNDDRIYKVNVSGKIYEIKHKILKTIPYFHEYITNKEESDCFMERSSMIFDHVLAYAIDNLHPYPSKYFYELDFYGLKYNKDVYKVNVLGKIYYLKRDILMKIPHFVKIINEMNNSSVEIFVDRSPLLFDQVLAYVMDEQSPIDCSYELHFYGIKYNAYRLCNTDINKIKNDVEDISKIKDKLNDIYDDITKIHTKLDENKDDKKFCEYPSCTNKIDDEQYCDNHDTCRYCHNDADRRDGYLCFVHR